MNGRFICRLFFVLLLACSGYPAEVKAKVPLLYRVEAEVYICDSKTAYAYHSSKDCRGLNRCTHEIKKIKLSEAKNLKRSPCKICE
jgi:hypothetical protein